MLLDLENIQNPRRKALDEIIGSVPLSLWVKNIGFITRLKTLISNHPISKHPAIQLLNSGEIDKEYLLNIHLEYRHAIVQIFTDALLMAQYQTKQLEPRLGAGSKMSPRFLLTLNVLDEFGFRPGVDQEGYYLGNPIYAHYPLFEQVLNNFKADEIKRNTFKPSAIADKVRMYLENYFDNYKATVALLAVAEVEVILFSPALRQATRAVGLNVDQGYYHVHGTSLDPSNDAADDDHENDLWYILAQACEEDDYKFITKVCLEYCDLWQEFWDRQFLGFKLSHSK